LRCCYTASTLVSRGLEGICRGSAHLFRRLLPSLSLAGCGHRTPFYILTAPDTPWWTAMLDGSPPRRAWLPCSNFAVQKLSCPQSLPIQCLWLWSCLSQRTVLLMFKLLPFLKYLNYCY
jgi:hypothetical protein